ncbi:hypothetical protein GCM10028808_09460 [Spirosoma migulaei]
MKVYFFAIISTLLLTFTPSYHQAQAQTTKETSLIAQLVKEANQTGAHSEGDVYLLVKIRETKYMAELKSGKVVDQRKADSSGGGICGDYAEVSINLLDKNKQETSQGAGQVLKWRNGKWIMIALSEGDYACEKLKGIPPSVLTCLKVECN